MIKNRLESPRRVALARIGVGPLPISSCDSSNSHVEIEGLAPVAQAVGVAGLDPQPVVMVDKHAGGQCPKRAQILQLDGLVYGQSGENVGRTGFQVIDV